MRRSCRDPYYNQIVLEYLLHMGLLDTATVFQQECGRKRLTVPPVPHNNKTGGAIKSKILNHFDSGEEDSFFQIFYSFISDKKLCQNENKKLVADLCLYFASLHYAQAQSHSQTKGVSVDVIRKFSQIPSDFDAYVNFRRLSEFLESDCSNLKEDPEFIPYFALLFASNPSDHCVFQQTFKDDWILNLRKRLHDYLCLHHPAFKVPGLVQHLPSEVKDNFLCCFPLQDLIDSGGGGEQEKNTYQNNEEIVTDMTDLTANDLTFHCNCSQDESDTHLEREKGHSVHIHKNAALFIRRQNQNILSSHNPTSGNELCENEKHEKLENQRDYQEMQKKFSQLHSDYHNLIGVASELTCALENSVRGQQIDLRETLNSCVQIFPDLFSPNKRQKSYKKKTSKENTLLSANYEWNLHITLIKRHLREGSVKKRLLLMQALRWAITRSSLERRECIMNQFVSLDVLDLQGDTLVSLLMPPGVVTPHPLQQSAARLLNTFASVQSGRSYLAQNSQAVKVTAAVLQQQDGISVDTITKNMLVAALQKLSLRRNQRITMIQSGVVEWLFQQLASIDLESSYSLEYGSALLMNLCLHQSAKEHCIPIAQSVFTILIGLLSTPISQALPYINGTLYSLVTHPQLSDAAAQVGLDKALEHSILKQSNVDIKTQMEHILKYHQSLQQRDHANMYPLPISEGELIDEDDEELDLLGEEVDDNDPVRNINGELNGEDLLHTHYTLPDQNNEYNGEAAITQVSEGCVSPLILRPTTPKHFYRNVAEDSKGMVASTNTQDLHKKNVWQHRRNGITQPKISSKNGDGSFRAESSNGTKKMSLKSEHAKEWSITGTEGQHFSNKSDKQRELPQISIQLASSVGSSETDNNFDLDDDSEDVQVATTSTPHGEPYSHHCGETIKTTVLISPAVERGNQEGPKTDNCETAAAFTSRPKIPRTPPHHP